MKAFVTILLLAIVSISFVSAEDKPQTVLQVPNGASNLSMVVKANKLFSIRLQGNPTTGYMWALTNADAINSSAVSPVEKNGEFGTFKPDPHQKGMVGVGGIFEFTFKAGEATNELIPLEFAYKRAWEQENGKVVTVKVQVTK